MATENEIIDSTSFRSRAAAVAAEPGSIAIQNVGNVLKSVDDQGVATTIGGGGGLLAANNLSDVASASTSRTNLGIQDPSAVAITGGTITGTTVDLIGIAGGRTIVGGTAASESLTYSSTSHATKGKHIWGTTAKMQFNEATSQLEIGGGTGLVAHLLHVYSNANSSGSIWNWNESAGTSSRAAIQVATGAGYAITFGMQNFSSGYTTSGQLVAGLGLLELAGGAGPLIISLNNATGRIMLTTTSSRTIRAYVPQLGGLVVGDGANALVTTATDGFLYIPTCAGTPTGVPAAQTGSIAMVFDTTNHKLYLYDGSWKGGTTPGAFI
jgi:hypothetical protein